MVCLCTYTHVCMCACWHVCVCVLIYAYKHNYCGHQQKELHPLKLELQTVGTKLGPSWRAVYALDC